MYSCMSSCTECWWLHPMNQTIFWKTHWLLFPLSTLRLPSQNLLKVHHHFYSEQLFVCNPAVCCPWEDNVVSAPSTSATKHKDLPDLHIRWKNSMFFVTCPQFCFSTDCKELTSTFSMYNDIKGAIFEYRSLVRERTLISSPPALIL